MAVEHRVVEYLEVQPCDWAGSADDALPTAFHLLKVTEYQRRDGRQRDWLQEKPRETQLVIASLSVEQLGSKVAKLVEDATSWLAYRGEE